MSDPKGTLYYKATRPDGTDFRTGTIDYAAALESGEVVRHSDARKVFDDPSTYLSVSVSAADCTGFSWPARLFRVEPVGRVMGADMKLSASPNKRAVSALRVVEELPAWQVFGPNGEAVVALIDRAVSLSREEVDGLSAAWDAAWDAARDAARYAAWYAARSAAWDAAWYAAWYTARALVVLDLISEEHFKILYGPWGEVIGTYQNGKWIK